MIAVQDPGDAAGPLEEKAGLQVAGIAARDHDVVDAGEAAKHLVALHLLCGQGRSVGVVPPHVGIPDPHVETVGVDDPREALHHLQRLHLEMRARKVVVGAWRQDLDRVGAEERELADVLIELLRAPGVVGIGLGAVAELGAAQPHARHGGEAEWRREDGVAAQLERAEETADAVEQAPRVGARYGGTRAGRRRHLEDGSLRCRARPR